MEALKDKIENTICSVCFEKGEQEKISGDKGEENYLNLNLSLGHTLLKCIKCELKVHLRCYGERNPHFKKSTHKNSEEDLFECEKCQNKDQSCACVICHIKDGYMVRIEHKKYVHVICALFTDYFEIEDFIKMKIEAKISLKDIEKINTYIINKNQCDICQNSQGILLECECESNENQGKSIVKCNHKTHFYCAMRDKFVKLQNDPDSTNYWQIDWKFKYEGTYINDKHDVYNVNLSAMKNQSEFNQIIGISNLNFNNNNQQSTIEVDEIAGNSKSNNKKKRGVKSSGTSKKSGKKTNSTEEILANSSVLLADNCSNDEEVLINYLNTKFTHINEKNWILKNRGGEIKALCEDHREQVIYCICRKSSGSEFMICCDNCETWFHGRCLGLSNKETYTIKKWYCSFCTEWINNRNNFLLKEANEDVNEDLITQAKGKSWKMPVIHNHLQYKVIDLLFITILYFRKAEVLINHPCSLEILSKHIKLGYQIPFNLSKLIFQLKKKEQKFLSRNFEAEKQILDEIQNFPYGEIEFVKTKILLETNAQMNDGEVSSDLKEEIELNWENYKVIENYYNIIQRLYDNINETSEGIINENISSVENAWKKFKWAKNVFEIISKPDSESSLQDVKSAYLSYNDIFCINNSSNLCNQEESNSITKSGRKPFEKEFNLITSYMTDYSSWQKGTKEMLSNHMKRKNEAERVLQEIETKLKHEEANLNHLNNSGNFINYLSLKISILNKQKEKMKINLDTKIQIQKIQEIIKIGQSLKINSTKEIESIDSCLKEALEWDSCYEKIKFQISFKIEEIQKLILSCTNILVCTPNMYEAIDTVFRYDIFIAKIENFLLNEKNSEITNLKILDEIIGDYEFNFRKFKDELIQQKTDAIFKIREKIQKLKEIVKDSLNNNNDIKILNKLREDLEKENKNFISEEMEKLEQKIFYLKNIEDLLNQKNDMKSLELIETLIDEYNINTAIDCNLKEKINFKKEKILKIRHKISEFFKIRQDQSLDNNNNNKNNLTIDDELRILQETKTEIESNKILLDEQKKIEDLITLIEWFKNASREFAPLLKLVENYDENSKRVLLENSLNSISEIETLFKENEQNLRSEIQNFFENLQFLIWRLKAERILVKFKKSNQNITSDTEINNMNCDDEDIHELCEKIEISELCSLLDESSNLRFSNLNNSEYRNYFQQLKNLNDQINVWLNNFKLLHIAIFEENAKNLELCNKLFNLLQADKTFTKINLPSEHSKLSEISTILNISEKLCTILETKYLPIEKRLDKEKILEAIKDCEIKLSKEKIKMPLRQFYFFQQINKELEKFESWIENYQQYIHHKRNNQADKIDFGLLEVLQEESKKILVNLSCELGILKRDLELNKNWINEAKNLIEISENLNDVDKILENQELIGNLQKVFSQLSNNQVAIPEKNLADMIRALEWATRARSLLKNVEKTTTMNRQNKDDNISIPVDKLNYRIAFRTSQEANSLKFFYEIKKKECYTNLMTQVSLAKNIRDITEILKNSSTLNMSHQIKHITEEQFDKIVKDFLNRCVVDLPEEREIVENFIKIKSQLEKKFESYVLNKASLSDFEKLSTELKKFPVNLEKLISAIEIILNDNKLIMKEIRKFLEQYNSGKYQNLLKEKVQAIYEKYKNNKASFLEGEQLARMYESSEEKIKKLKSNLINNENLELDIYDLINLMDSIEIHNSKEEKVLKKKLWKRKFQSFVDNESNKLNSSPTFVIIRNLVVEANELNILDPEESCKEEYNKLLDIYERSQEIIKEIFFTKNLQELETIKNKIQEDNLKIELGDFIIEQETRLSLNKILPPAQVTRNLENLFLGFKRKSDEKLRHLNLKKSSESIDQKDTSKLADQSNIQIIKHESAIEEENYPVKEEVSLILEGVDTTQNVVSISTPSLANSRSKRKVNIKLDKDYFYDKEFLDNFENKIAQRRLKKAEHQVNTSNENDKFEEISEINEELREIKKKNNNLSHTPFEFNKKEQSLSLVQTQTHAAISPSNVFHDSKSNLIKNFIKKNSVSNIALEIPKKEENFLIHHNPLRQNSVENFIKILNDNSTFNKEGTDYVKKLAIELEDELYKTYNKLDNTYKKGLENMSKTLRELEKFKRVSILVTKGKLNLPKVAKFPYGPQYFEKLKKIDDSVQSQISQKNKKKDEKEEVKVTSEIRNLDNIDLSQTVFSTCEKEKKDETNLISLMSDMGKLYSSLHKSSKNEIKNKSTSISEFGIEPAEDAHKNLDDDNESLKSVSDKEDVRFSPDGGHNVKSIGSNVFTTTAKSSNVQSPSSPNKPLSLKKEISIISTFENIYNPFETEDELKDKDDLFESNLNNLNVINVKSVRSSTQNAKQNLAQPIFYDPFKKSENISRNKSENPSDKSNVMNITKKSVSNYNTILQIWKGNLSVSRLNLKNISMCSTNSSDSLSQFQKFPNEINISSKAKTKEVIPYIERYLANKSDKISYGWFEIVDESEIDTYQGLADEYDKNDRSGFHSFRDSKYYIFTLTKRYPKFYKKMKNEFRIFNKYLMNSIDKLLVYVMIKKNEGNNELGLEDFSKSKENCIEPIILKTLVETKENNENKHENKKVEKNDTQAISTINTTVNRQSSENIQMSPITSDEEENGLDNEEILKENFIANKNNFHDLSSSKKDYLQELLDGDDLEKLEEYVNSQFANLSQEDIIQKLMSLDENSRAKLLNMIMQYQQRIASNVQERNENEEINQEEEEYEMDVENIEKDSMEVDDMNISYQAQTGKNKAYNLTDIKPSSNNRINDHLSYLGFSSSNASTDLLKKEILKNQIQGQSNQNVETTINEDTLKKNMNINLNLPMSNQTNPQMFNPYMNNYSMMNMNQAYMLNPNYSQNVNYHQMGGVRPNMQMMMPHASNYNQMMMQNMGYVSNQPGHNMNMYNQRSNMQNNKNNNLNK